MPATRVPVETRLADVDLLLTAARALFESYRPDTFDGKKARTKQAKRMDELLDQRLVLVVERLIEHRP